MPAQTDFYDAQLRHHIYVQRFAAGNVKKLLAVLAKSDKELTAKLASRVNPGDFTSKRYKELLADIKTMRRDVMRSISSQSRVDMKALGRAEQEAAYRMLQNALPVRLDFAVADVARLDAMITQHPFSAGANSARTLDQWWSGLATADANRITSALQYGLVQGETIGQITARIRQATDMTRSNAEAVARTAVNHASNTARNEFFKQNQTIVNALMWSSTLDGRTTVICMSYDGHYAPANGESWDGIPQPHLETPQTRPPAHVQCRSYMVGILSADGVAQLIPERAYVRDTRTREWREKDFRVEAKAKAGSKWKSMSNKDRNAAVRSVRTDWARTHIGTVPGKTTYGEWLAKQNKAFQNDVLGTKKAELFRAGTPLDKFVDRRGGELSLEQIKKRT